MNEGPARRQREERAKRVCASCPAQDECGLFALNAREQFGVWGGISETERLLILEVRDTPTRRHGDESMRRDKIPAHLP